MKDEIVEELARAQCLAGGFDPDELMPNDGQRWRYYAAGIEAIAPIIDRLVSEARKEGRREIANAYVSAMRTAKGSGHA